MKDLSPERYSTQAYVSLILFHQTKEVENIYFLLQT